MGQMSFHFKYWGIFQKLVLLIQESTFLPVKTTIARDPAMKIWDFEVFYGRWIGYPENIFKDYSFSPALSVLFFAKKMRHFLYGFKGPDGPSLRTPLSGF
jgi:hypothetical protein